MEPCKRNKYFKHTYNNRKKFNSTAMRQVSWLVNYKAWRRWILDNRIQIQLVAARRNCTLDLQVTCFCLQFNHTTTEEMTRGQLNKCLPKFNLSTRKRDGTFYNKKSLTAIRAALERHLRSPPLNKPEWKTATYWLKVWWRGCPAGCNKKNHPLRDRPIFITFSHNEFKTNIRKKAGVHFNVYFTLIKVN